MAENEGSEVAVAANNENAGAVETAGNATVGENGQVEEAQAAPAQGGGFWSIAKTLLVRCLFMYMISSFLRRGTTPTPPAQTSQDGKPLPPALTAHNIFMKEMALDLYIYISEDELFTDFKDEKALFWLEEDILYGDWLGGFNNDGTFERKGQLHISDAVKNNGSLYIHTYFVRSGKSPNPEDKENYSRKFTLYKSKRLNKYKKRKFSDTVNLLTGETDAHPDLIKTDNRTVEIVNCWHPNMTIILVEDYTPWTQGGVPAPLNEYIEFIPGTSEYKPILFYNDYWNLNGDYMPINETTPVLNISLTYSPMSLFKWQMYAAQTMRNKWYSSFLGEDVMGEESDEEQDSLKTTLVETNPYLLGLTIVVSLVHSVFEFLAFKNDIQFWRNRKSLEGLSVRSVFFNVFQSLIVVLYVMDNETNFVVRISVVVGLVIEMWKIFKVIDFKFDRENTIFGLPRPTFQDKSTYVESDTKRYDKLAFRYLSWLLFPLLGCYAVYSVLYNEHRGWYSWVLSILYGFLLMFGFIMMTPQLFINYKMKSVAHLPWRMLTYKALNTFIDDLFAFVIKMPTLYRIGCFRDDIVFLIFVYQRYIYPVDKKRVNEYGLSAEMLEQDPAAVTAAEEQANAEQNGSPPAIEATPDAANPAQTTPDTSPKPNKAKKNSPNQKKQKNKKAKKND